MLSISSQWEPLGAHASQVAHDDLHVVARVNVSLGNRVQDVSQRIFNFLLRAGQLLHHHVVPNELVVQDGQAERIAGPLGAVGVSAVAAHGIVAVDDSLAVLVDSAKQVERVVGHKAAAVEGGGQQLRNILNARLSFVLHLVLTQFDHQVFMQSLHISHHPSAGKDAGFSQLDCLRLIASKDRVAIAYPCVCGNHYKVLACNRCTIWLISIAYRALCLRCFGRG